MNTVGMVESSGDGEPEGNHQPPGSHGSSWSASDEAAAYADLRGVIAREGLRLEIQPGRLTSAYDVGKPVGKGKFATVYKATRVADGEVVALKALAIFDVMDARSREKCLREIKLVQSLDHPNVIRFLEGFVDGSQLVLVFELAAAGDLKRQLRKARERHARFEEAVIWKYFAQLAAAVAHMHARRILHRDLKPANVMLTLAGVVKVGDLGLGRLLGNDTLAAHSTVGTPLYMAPEVLRGGGHDSAADAWSMGCILYELAMMVSPFREPGLSLASLFEKIQLAVYPPVAEVYSAELRALVADLLQHDPTRRPTMAVVVVVAERMREVTARLKAEARATREREIAMGGVSAAAAAAAAAAAVVARGGAVPKNEICDVPPPTPILTPAATPFSTSISMPTVTIPTPIIRAVAPAPAPALQPSRAPAPAPAHTASSAPLSRPMSSTARTLTHNSARTLTNTSLPGDGDNQLQHPVVDIGLPDLDTAVPFLAASHLHDRLLRLGFFDPLPPSPFPFPSPSPSPSSASASTSNSTPALVSAHAGAADARADAARDRFFFAHAATLRSLVAVATWLGAAATAGPRVDARARAQAAAAEAASRALRDTTAAPLAVATALALALCAASSTTIIVNAASLAKGHGSSALEILSMLAQGAEAALGASGSLVALVAESGGEVDEAGEASESDGEGEGEEVETESSSSSRRLCPLDSIKPPTTAPPLSADLWAAEVSRSAARVHILIGGGAAWRTRLSITSAAIAELTEGIFFHSGALVALADACSEASTRVRSAEAALAGDASAFVSSSSSALASASASAAPAALHALVPLVAEATQAERARRAASARLTTATDSLSDAAAALDALDEGCASTSQAADDRAAEVSGGGRLTELRKALVVLKRDSADMELQMGLLRAQQFVARPHPRRA